MGRNLIKGLTDWAARRQFYHFAAAGVWGLILAFVLGVIEFDGQSGRFLLRENWFLATIGLSAIMYTALAVLKKKLAAEKPPSEEQIAPED
ncbi:MAG TPA: hypothetical protein VNL14_19225 [Candidatus Acidoferrales bacterium]|nr:hypothetical protein [Candidatus Acidoferrales bacterium]